ncbi:MAG: hypothetical protein R3C56_02715 [Pirellulaceae bacterium]
MHELDILSHVGSRLRRHGAADATTVDRTHAAAHPANEGVIGAVSDTMMQLNDVIAWSALALAAFQLPFIFNFFYSVYAGRRVESDNPWQATTLEWQTPTPPPHGNFTQDIFVYRGPYAYSLNHPGSEASVGTVDELPDFEPQNQPLVAVTT